jgi:predicted 3-demethylubiquinone-9 3-methyltransferase (glyoxalase superfamily)
MFTGAAEEAMRCFDSDDVHDFGFTPAVSLFVECDSAEEVDQMLHALSVDGQVFMPAGQYPFAERFAWATDRFGVSWQLSYPVGA